MLFLIRETLLINWGRGNVSVMKADKTATDKEVIKQCNDFVDCPYCKADKALKIKAA